MPTHDYIIANGTGAAVRADINAALSAIVSLNSSASEPGTMYAYQLWADTTSNLLKIRNSANSAWITLRQLDGDFSIVAVEDGLQATPSLTFTNDLNTGIFRPGNDSLSIVTNALRAITITSTQAVGIQTANPSTALHVAGNARVGADDTTDAHLQIGKGATGNRNSYIDIVGDTTYTDYGLRVIRNNGGADATSEIKHRGTGAFNIVTQEAAPIQFYTTNSPRLTITSGGNVGIGNSNVSDLLHIGNSSVTTRTAIRVQTGGAYSDPNSVSYSNALSAVGARYAIDGTASGYIGQIGVGNSANLWLGSWNNGATDGSIQFATGNNTTSTIRATLNSTGLGIGDTGPDSTLTIKAAASTTPLRVSGPSSEFARIDSSGRLLVGTSSARTNFYGAYTSSAQIEGTGFQTAALNITCNNTTDIDSGVISLNKSGGAGIGSNTIVSSGERLGSLRFQGNDGVAFQDAAYVLAEVDGTPGVGDMPGRLVFSTTADGESSPTPRMTIDSAGRLLVSTSSTSHGGGGGIQCSSVNATSHALIVNQIEPTAGTTYKLISGYRGVFGVSAAETFIVYNNGNVQNTNNSYLGISDVKLKENIVDASSQWNDIKDLQVRNYNFKEGQTHTQIGLVAQEVELVSPGLVSESPDRDEKGNDLGTVTKSVNYSVLYMKAVKALQEAMERIETLEARLTAAGID